MKKPEIKQTKRHMRCDLTDAEILAAGKQLADRSAELITLQNEKSRITSDFGARIKGKEADIAILTSKVQSGYEYRDVDCDEILDMPKPGKKTIKRRDTGETVTVEDMTPGEMQRELYDEQEVKTTISCGGVTGDFDKVQDALKSVIKKAQKGGA